MSISVPAEKIAEFCARWGVEEFSLFGSSITQSFHADSDVDVLVRYAPRVRHGVVAFAQMLQELEAMFGRRVDLVEDGTLRNPFRRQHILSHRRVLYAA